MNSQFVGKAKEAIVKRVEPQITDEQERELIEQSGVDVDDPPLTKKDKDHCLGLCQEGFNYFKQLDWDRERETNFLSRPKVRREMDRLRGQLSDSEGLVQRTQFFARLRNFRLLPAAQAIVEMALVGTANGTPVEKLPTDQMLKMAESIINWCGVGHAGGGTNITVNTQNNIALPAMTPDVSDGESHTTHSKEAILGRTRVRTVLEKLVKEITDTDARIEELKDIRSATKVAMEKNEVLSKARTAARKKRYRDKQRGQS